MERYGLEFHWPGIFFVPPLIIVGVVLPAWLLTIVFRHGKLSTFKKFLLVPVCILGPFLSMLFWPLVLQLTGLIRITPDGSPVPYLWVANELFGDWSEYVWVGISTIFVFMIHYILNRNNYSFKMKYILVPLTIFLWYLTAYYGLYIIVFGMVFMFSLGWLWLIIGYWFLILIGIWITTAFALLRALILYFYGIKWFSCIVHSLAGIVGVILFSANPPELVIGNESYFFLTGMWELAPFRTVFLAFPFAYLLISLLWSTIIAPFYIKLSEDNI